MDRKQGNKQGKNVAEQLGDFTFMSEMLKYCKGPVRAAKMYGWCVLVGAALREGESSGAAVERLMRLGLSRGKSFEICSEIKGFKQHLETVLDEKLKVEDVVQKIRSECASPDGDLLV